MFMEELIGTEILWFDEFYDGAVDGLARHGQREFWFCVDDSSVTWFSDRPRRYFAFELTEDELATVSSVRLADQTADGPRATRVLGGRCELGGDTGYAPSDRDPVGWFAL
jgi:hypothetical protein